MKLLKFNPRKSKAQAIVEFAIVLPILLLVVYGLIEVGRLLFIYSSVNNVTRQAARWGSTSGVGDNSVPRYQDCEGIRAAAQGGDRFALDQLLRRHYDRIHAVCRRVAGSTRDASAAK